MKANRKFLGRDDEAVSPVIAVILMVAITVVLAATVYVWVSGFGQGNSQTKSAAFSATSSGGIASLTLVSASQNLDWNNMKITVDGVTSGTYGIVVIGPAYSGYQNNAAWDGANTLTATKTALPGDIVKFGVSATPTGAVHLNFVDKNAGTIMATVTMPTLAAQTTATLTCTTTLVTSTTPLYSKSGVASDTAAIQITGANTPDATRTGTTVTSISNTVGGTTYTVNAGASTNVFNFIANKAYDIGGTPIPAANTCTAP